MRDSSIITVMLKSHFGNSPGVVARHIHIPVQLLHPIPVVAGIAYHHGARVSADVEQRDDTPAPPRRYDREEAVVLQDDLILAVVIDIDSLGMRAAVLMFHPSRGFGGDRGLACMAGQRAGPRAGMTVIARVPVRPAGWCVPCGFPISGQQLFAG